MVLLPQEDPYDSKGYTHTHTARDEAKAAPSRSRRGDDR